VSIEIVKVPDLGGATDVEVIELCVAIGDTVQVEDSLIVLETDKASMEVPSPIAGKVVSISVSEGDTLNEGVAILELELEGEQGEPESASVSEEAPAPQSKDTVKDAQAQLEPQASVVTTESSLELVTVPDIGGATDVEVIEICVAVGDVVAEGDSLIVLETDKASMEIPSPAAGTVIGIRLTEGAQVAEGSEILELEVAGATVAPAAPLEQPPSFREPAKTPEFIEEQRRAQKVEHRISDARPSKDVYAGPAVRQLARELGVDLADVQGSGPKGRIQKDDLHAYVKNLVKNKGKASGPLAAAGGAGIPPIPDVDFSKFGEIDIQPLSKIHKVTAANMQRSWLNVPHVTQFDDIDITDLEDFRQTLKAEAERAGVKITPLPFLLKACAAALKANPKINASLSSDGENMIFKQYVHIGMAVDTPAGLVVPVIKDVDKKSIFELAAETVELAKKAKERKLKPAEMQGGCFTISSLGGIGGTGFTPIVNAPEVAILGVSKLAVKPVWDGKEFLPRKMLPVGLSYDHRAINGADAGRFLTELGQMLADIRRLAL
jgi:pyruvate dehydrogenase E2 component (dihydrolipoamide acetyltransferase)